LRYALRTADGALIGVADGRIASDGRYDVQVALGPGELRPGLINAHDHLHRNHFPRLGAPPYPDSYAWGDDLHARWAEEVARGRALDRRDALLFGALKNLIAGATTVVHHDRREQVFDEDFPVRVPRIRVAHSLGTEPELVAAGGSGDRAMPLCVHLAEGTTAAAAAEVRRLDDVGLIDPDLVAVHCVGVDADGIDRLRRGGAAMTWCPTSNDFLFGRTAPRELLASGIDVLLGSDSLLTGAGTILDELRAARSRGILTDDALVAAVGRTAARRLRLPAPSLALGAPADLVHLRRPLLDATPDDLALVIVGGVPRVGDEGLFEHAGVVVERLAFGHGTKLVAAPLATLAARVVAAWPECGRIFRA
jgi:cytosine/adenosine deaminase-related metal-dependent hydrolase